MQVAQNTPVRLNIRKTYKMYIGGSFPRSESGHYYIVEDQKKEPYANMCRASRKDLRDSVLKARNALKGWSSSSAYLRSQILYRIAEMLDGRSQQFVEELIVQGHSADNAKKEVNTSVDRLVYYAGWCDKYQQVFSSVNPVASSHFNFTVPQPMGVVSIFSPQESPLLSFISLMSSCIAGGNTSIILADQKNTRLIEELASENMKRIVFRSNIDWYSTEQAENPYWILDTQEKKTTWHPIESYSSKDFY